MSGATPVEGAAVAIGRVRVVTAGASRFSPARAEDGPAPRPANPGDHRILVDELRIEADTSLSDEEARRLGARVARGVGARLADLQRTRLDAIAAGDDAGGVLRLGTVCARLRHSDGDAPVASTVVDALMSAVERRVRSWRTT